MRKIKYNVLNRAIALPTQGQVIPEAVPSRTVGFGFTAPTGQTAPNPKILVAALTTLNNRDCEQVYRRRFDASQFVCARDKQRNGRAANVCLGDNGNGLYALPKDLRPRDRETPEREAPQPENPGNC